MSGFNNYNSLEGIPVYLLSVDDPNATIQTVSLVECPATGLPLYCFEKEEKYKFSTDELKHNIISCIVRVDYPILRTSADGEPYYVVFNKQTSEMLCQKLLKDGFQQNISLDHNGQLIEGIQLEQVFIKDSSRGIVPSGFESAADGSLFGIYHITDESLWNDCVSGRFGGVSLESLFKLIPISNIDERKKLNQYKMSNKISKIKENNYDKRIATHTKRQVFDFKENYGEFKTYHCTIPEFVKQKAISTNKMYSLIKSGLLEKSKPEVRRSKPKRSDKVRKRMIKEYVLYCAEKGVPIEIDI